MRAWGTRVLSLWDALLILKYIFPVLQTTSSMISLSFPTRSKVRHFFKSDSGNADSYYTKSHVLFQSYRPPVHTVDEDAGWGLALHSDPRVHAQEIWGEQHADRNAPFTST